MIINKEKPLAVVIPVFNREKFIPDAIQSVLNQHYNSLKVIVVDDGSTDDTKKEVLKFDDRVTYVYQENGGPAKARNTGILASDTEFISFLDSDDVWHPKNLEKQFSEFEKYKNLQIALGLKQVLYVDPDGNNSGDQKGDIIFNLSFGSSLMKRSVFDVVGLLDEELQIGEDTDWFFRAREKGVIISVHRHVVQYYRKHKTNLTSAVRVSPSSVLKVLKKAKDRKTNSDAARTFALRKPSDIDELIAMWNTASPKKNI